MSAKFSEALIERYIAYMKHQRGVDVLYEQAEEDLDSLAEVFTVFGEAAAEARKGDASRLT